jgi:hypothetical protein
MMATPSPRDTNLKKIVISPSDLPGFSAIDGGYTIRYRVITEDGNQFSDWSPFYFLPTTNQFTDFGEDANTFVNDPNYIRVVGAGKVLDIQWQDLSRFGIRRYDVFTNFNNNGWSHHTTTGNNSSSIGLFNTLKNNAGEDVPLISADVKVLVATPQKIYEESLVLFKRASDDPISLA